MTKNQEDQNGNPHPGDQIDDLHLLEHHAALPETGFSRSVDRLVRLVGEWSSWIWVVLMLVICVNVFMKNVLGRGSVQLEEIQWHIYAALFLLGLGYTLIHDDHVRVDLVYENMSLRTKAWVDLVGILLFLVPFLLVLLWFAWPFVLKAVEDGERSSSPAGLSNYWIIKSFILTGLGLLLLAALGRVHRCIAYLFLGAGPQPKAEG